MSATLLNYIRCFKITVHASTQNRISKAIFLVTINNDASATIQSAIVRGIMPNLSEYDGLNT